MAGLARKGLRRPPLKTQPLKPPLHGVPKGKGKAKRKVKVTRNSPTTIKVSY